MSLKMDLNSTDLKQAKRSKEAVSRIKESMGCIWPELGVMWIRGDETDNTRQGPYWIR